jgi:magnesium transporter
MDFQQQLDEVIKSVGTGTLDELRYLLETLYPHEIANLLESTPPRVRRVVWELLDEDASAQVLQYLSDDVRADFLQSMDTAALVAAADELDTDDFADILQQLPDTLTQRVLAGMDEQDRARVEAVLSYPEDSAGGLMNTDMVTVRPRHSLELVLRYLRRRRALPDTTDSLIVVNDQDEYVGMLSLSTLVVTDPSVTVREVMDTEVEAIQATLSDAEVAHIFADRDLVSAPVVNADGVLVGRITIDDVVDVIIEDADESVLARAGLDVDEDMFAPILRSSRRRAVWLGINLATALLAAAVINVYEATIAKVVALAVLMPIVASMGGIAGSQTLTLVIRSQALGQISRSNLAWLINREAVVALLNGLLWATLLAVGTGWLFEQVSLGALIGAALMLNMLVAAISGTVLPPLLRRLNIDPALAGGVVLTTITDVAGFAAFLGLATLVYM